MIVVFRNFFRNKMVNLTAKSVKHFIPDAELYCVSYYKNDPSEYDDQEPLDKDIQQFLIRTKYVNEGAIHDHEDSTKTSGYQNADNVKYFVEGYNDIIKLFTDVVEKVLILGEDHYFTTGAVLNELQNNDFHLAYAPWDTDNDANGSILCVRPARVKHLFPIPERGPCIEAHLRDQLVLRVPNSYAIKNRKHANYFGDGKYTNSSVEIEQELKKANII